MLVLIAAMRFDQELSDGIPHGLSLHEQRLPDADVISKTEHRLIFFSLKY